MKFTSINIICLFFISSFILAVENEKFAFVNEIYSDSWALIIGINDYQNVDPLTYAVNDAIAVKEMLINKYGFVESNITLILDEKATKDNILEGFSKILTKAKEKDRVVVFYAGHGETYKLPSGGDMGYLIPVDGNSDNLYLSSIPMKSIYDIAEMSYAKHILYLVDACYGGLTMNTRGLKKNTTPEYIKKMTRERGRQVITAGGKDEQVQERPEWGHSAFTRNLLKGLGESLADENLDGIITGDELGGFIKNRVIIDVDGAHTPQKGRIGSDMGEFVFISETLDTQIAQVETGDDKLSDLELEMQELKKLLRDSQGQSSIPKLKPHKEYNAAVASTLSFMFPGMGHYYSGRAGKGILFTGLAVGALAGIAGTSQILANETNNYQRAEKDVTIAVADPSYGADGDIPITTLEKDRIDAFNAKQSAMYGLIGAGTLTAGIWIWNILDVKKTNALNYSDSYPLNFGINSQGQFELQIHFDL